jgi:tRNA(Arg) A34 adenosine deaminase TadA
MRGFAPVRRWQNTGIVPPDEAEPRSAPAWRMDHHSGNRMPLSRLPVTESDRRLMRVALAVAERAKAAGRHPFGAIYWCNIGRVVYAMSEERLLELTGSHPENPTLSLPCRTVFASGQRPTVVVGPLPEMEQEAAAPHVGFWE